MFHPTRIWRKWHRRVNQNERRYAVCSALAASAVPALVMARGHQVSEVPELPLVLGNVGAQKTKEAVKILESFGIGEDLQRVRDSKNIRAGVGKMRNRRFVKRRGPLVIHASTSPDLARAFRNIEGVDLCHVDRLNLLQLAPGGHIGRLVVWTQDAFEKLDAIYGTHTAKSTEKSNYRMPRAMVSNADITRIINSDEIQKVVRAKMEKPSSGQSRKKNALRNKNVMTKLNPYAEAAKRAEQSASAQRKSRSEKVGNTRAARKAFYTAMME
jgi:large subunit ribosomal protein L4e